MLLMMAKCLCDLCTVTLMMAQYNQQAYVTICDTGKYKAVVGLSYAFKS
jgi:hypothetical protein